MRLMGAASNQHNISIAVSPVSHYSVRYDPDLNYNEWRTAIAASIDTSYISKAVPVAAQAYTSSTLLYVLLQLSNDEKKILSEASRRGRDNSTQQPYLLDR